MLKPAIAKEKKYCSSQCAFTARYGEGGSSRARTIFCAGCNREVRRIVKSNRDEGKYCSSDCYSEWKANLSREKLALRRIGNNWRKPQPIQKSLVQIEGESLRRIAKWKPGDSPTVRPCRDCGSKAKGLGERSRKCVQCHEQRKAEHRAAARKTENRKRHKRIYKSRRRAIERGIHADRIDPLKVFARDKWTCHLCGIKTPERLRGTYEPRAPELDHVVPLAAGGTHTWGNVKCSCRQCNGMKSDKAMGQLGLDIAV